MEVRSMGFCVFGDSVARGIVYDESKKKYTYLKSTFENSVSLRWKVAIKNYARFGCTITKGAEILEKHKADLGKFRYTALEFGGNDCDFNWKEISKNPDLQHLPNVPLSVFEKSYEQIIEQVQNAGSIPILVTLPPLDAQRFFDWVSKGLNKENILKFVGDVQYIYRWHELYNITILELAQKYKLPLINIRKDFLANKNYKDLLCKDGMHPNEKGHALINQSIANAIPGLL